MKTVCINLQAPDITHTQNDPINYTRDVPINAIITLDAAFVDMTTYLNTGDLGVLLQLQHQGPLTLLNLTGVTPYVLLCFDDDLNYQGAAYSLKSASGSFTIQTPYKTLLFVRLPHDLKLNHIQNLSYDAH